MQLRQKHEAGTHGPDDGPQGVPGVHARAGAPRVRRAGGQHAHRERKRRADEERAGQHDDRGHHRPRGRGAGARPSATEGREPPWHLVDQREREKEAGGDTKLGQAEASSRPRPVRGQPRRDCRAESDADQEVGEHDGEGIDAAPEDVAQQARPEDLPGEGNDAGDQHRR